MSAHSNVARPATIRDEDITEAARDVFLARGIRATTAEVAERAGISEGSIFKRFRSKVELFEAAMRPLIEEPPFLAKLPALGGRGEIRQGLVEIGLEVVASFRATAPLMMMAWSNPDPASGMPRLLCHENPAPLRILGAFRAYFEGEMERGRLCRQDPEILARAFLGSLHNFVLFDLLFATRPEAPGGGARAERTAEETRRFVEDLVRILWEGVAPDASPGE